MLVSTLSIVFANCKIENYWRKGTLKIIKIFLEFLYCLHVLINLISQS